MIRILTAHECILVEKALEIACDLADDHGAYDEAEEIREALMLVQALERKSIEEVLGEPTSID